MKRKLREKPRKQNKNKTKKNRIQVGWLVGLTDTTLHMLATILQIQV